MTRRQATVTLLAALLLAGPFPARAGEEKPSPPPPNGNPFGGGDLGPPTPKPNDYDKPLPVRVNQAIDAGVQWLKGKTPGKPQAFISARGNWSDEILGNRLYDPNAKGDVYVHPTGCTSLSLYALLKSGVPVDDPVIKNGFHWLKTARGGITKAKNMATAYRVPNGTYEIAALILALEAKANPHKMEGDREKELRFKSKKGAKLAAGVKLAAEDEPWMRELVAALVKRLNRGRGWRYGHHNGQAFDNGPRGDSDLSASNLAMLALLAAERCGISVDSGIYLSVLKWTLTMQEKDGPPVKRWEPKKGTEDERYAATMDKARGFGYLGVGGGEKDVEKEKVATGSMTACGLANILICSGVLEARDVAEYTPELQAQAEKSWWDGVAWLDQFWTVSANANKGNYHYYYLYCLERACDLKRVNLIAGHPWYTEGAQVLVDEQLNADNGAWTKNDTHQPHEILNTCFALLFLNRATPAITGSD